MICFNASGTLAAVFISKPLYSSSSAKPESAFSSSSTSRTLAIAIASPLRGSESKPLEPKNLRARVRDCNCEPVYTCVAQVPSDTGLRRGKKNWKRAAPLFLNSSDDGAQQTGHNTCA